MKTYNLFLTGFLLITLFMPAFMAEPCTAAFVPSNNITVERNGMTWGYQEQITGNESVVFRSFIDLEAGDSDKFVNAWEILKAENILRNKMEESVKAKPDVKLNGTSEFVNVTDIDYLVSEDALGKTEKESLITSSATVSYTFEKQIDQDTNIWFMGTPNSNVTINLPAGFDVERTEGLSNESKESENNYTVLKGSFSPEKNITIWISENETYKAEMQEREKIIAQNAENKTEESKTNETVNKIAENKTIENKTNEIVNKNEIVEKTGKAVEARKVSEYIKNFYTWFCQIVQKVNLV
ncbi:hypothetical protein MSBR3_2207 [Methanosarcina barkeri 3]|uniref:Uncharacterized protein n=2 Tax=Methanosarcina barkeri TaxID=2208 RepID=A0A0E3WXB3_METBA|nr:hypothetical protein MSBR3_2207 [Methanosarcina barkeri 3]